MRLNRVNLIWICFFFFVSGIFSQDILFVYDKTATDWKELANEYEKELYKLNRKQFEMYSKFYEILKKQWDLYFKYMKPEELKKIQPRDILSIVNRYLQNLMGNETWGNLFEGKTKIFEKYPELGDYSYIYKNPLYKNMKWKKVYDFKIKEDKDQNKDFQNTIDMIAEIKDWDSKTFKKETTRIDEINRVSTEEKGAQAQQMTIELELKLDNMYQRIKIVIMLRSYLEQKIKDEIREMAIERMENEISGSELK